MGFKSTLLRGGVIAMAGMTLNFLVQQSLNAQETEKKTLYGNMETVTQDLLNRAAGDGNNFLHTNGNYEQTRYYPNRQINVANVRSCGRPGSSRPTSWRRWRPRRSSSNGIMYVTTAFDHVYALDARTGEQLWRYKHEMGRCHHLLLRPEQPRRRGLWRHGLPGHARRPAGGARRQDRQGGVGDRRSPIPRLGYSETMAPTAVDGKILIGTNGGEYGIRGFVKAYDAKTGDLLWTFDTIPENSVGVWATNDATGRDMHRDIAAEKAALAKNGDPYKTLGGGVWQNPAVDLGDQPHLLRGRQSLARPRRRPAPGRQPLHRLAGLGRSRHRQVCLPLPVHRA